MLTEVAILPPPQSEPTRKFAPPSKRPSVSGAQNASIMNAYNQTQCALRLQPAEQLPASSSIADKNAFIAQPFSGLLSRRNFERLAGAYHRDEVVLVTLRIISPPADVKDLLDEHHPPIDSVIVRLFCIEGENNLEQQTSPASTGNETDVDVFNFLYVNQLLFEHFRTIPGAKVLATSLPPTVFIPKMIEIVTTNSFFNKADELVRNYLCTYIQDGGHMLLNSGVVMEEPAEKCRFQLKFTPANEKYLVVDQKLMRECKFKLFEGELVDGKSQNNNHESPRVDLCLNASNYQHLVDNIVKYCRRKNSSVILTGKTGSGKTSLTIKISEVLKAAPSHYYVENVACRKLKGKNIESMLKTLNSMFLRLIYYQPSILILDDLHVICEKVIEGEQPTQENLHFNK